MQLTRFGGMLINLQNWIMRKSIFFMGPNGLCLSSYSLLAQILRFYGKVIIYEHKSILVKAQGCIGFSNSLIFIFLIGLIN